MRPVTWETVKARIWVMHMAGDLYAQYTERDFVLENVYAGKHLWGAWSVDPVRVWEFLDEVARTAKFYSPEEKVQIRAEREKNRQHGAFLRCLHVDTGTSGWIGPDMEPHLSHEQRRRFARDWQFVKYRIRIWLHLGRYEIGDTPPDIDMRVEARYNARLHVEWVLYYNEQFFARFVRVDKYGLGQDGQLEVFGGSALDNVQVVEFGQRPGAPETIDLQPIRPRARRTDKLSNVPAIRVNDCPACGQDYCSFCGQCHAAGCCRARVMCGAALDRAMHRDSVPEDVAPAPPLRKKRRFLFW